MYFWLNHIPEKVEFLYVRKRVVEKCIGHGYVVFKYVRVSILKLYYF